MSKISVLIVVLLTCTAALSQEAAQMSSAGEVQAGEIVTFTVTLDKEPAFADPAILVVAGPENGGAPGVKNVALAKDSKTNYRASLRIPATAAEGAWTIKEVRLLVPAGRSVPLKVNPTRFEVRKTDIELPTSATVSMAK
ncbi:MAG: hypothetical protein L0Z53_15645 [Acidobacteriales bacterium]|nr:hypothetical protein [Terriglobales bacterium]